MSRRYQHDNTDNNQPEIVRALRKIPGLSVETGHDDIIIGYKGRNYWYEIKNPAEVKKDGTPVKRKNKTYDKQMNLQANFTGHYAIVTTVDQILEEIMSE